MRKYVASLRSGYVNYVAGAAKMRNFLVMLLKVWVIQLYNLSSHNVGITIMLFLSHI